MDAEKLAEQAAARVREVVDEAEHRAKEIIAQAEAEGARIRERAEVEARQRIESARRALDDLEGRLGGEPARSEVEPGPVVVPEPEPPVPETDPSPVTVPEPAPPTEPEPMPPRIPEPQPPGPEENGEPAAGNEQAARLVAMKMALDGASREEIDERLAAYGVADREALLEEVLSRASGA
jgi:hypothetical protein